MWSVCWPTVVWLKSFGLRQQPHRFTCRTAYYWYDMMVSQRQNVAYLRPFGCMAFAKVPKKLVRSKLKPRLVRCVLVRYAGLGGYYFFDQASRIIVTSHDIIFNKDMGHRTHTDPNSIYDFFAGAISHTWCNQVSRNHSPDSLTINSTMWIELQICMDPTTDHQSCKSDGCQPWTKPQQLTFQ